MKGLPTARKLCAVLGNVASPRETQDLVSLVREVTSEIFTGNWLL